MSGSIGFDNVKATVAFLTSTAARSILIAKNWQQLVSEVKDAQIDEIVDVCLVEVKNGIFDILNAIKA